MTMFSINHILLLGHMINASFILTAKIPAAFQDMSHCCNSLDTFLPGKGLKQHDFLYTGEWDYRKQVQTIYVVADGKVAWSYAIPFKDATGNMTELGDATMRSNGNIVFCSKVGASEITQEKKIVWNYEAPPGTEVHVVQPLGIDRIFFVVNGVPAIGRIVNIKTGKTEKEFILPTGKPGAHLQFRRVRLLESGNILAAHLDNDKVTEYDGAGKIVWSYNVVKPWSASRLANGNTLITSSEHHVREVNKNGDIIWELGADSIAGIPLYQFQGAERLENGNTVFCNWCNKAVSDTSNWPGTVQLLEITPDKKLEWALSEWRAPDLGPASSIQILSRKYLEKIRRYNQESNGRIK